MTRILLQPAFVLHQRPYRNTSLLLDVFTRDYGRLGVVARGVRQRANSDRALLQPFNNVLIS
ncbi:MAG TPA: recombination protein O N-terminal domain-containing protein, partial [Gammaproteobacteria bacterium]